MRNLMTYYFWLGIEAEPYHWHLAQENYDVA